MRLLYHCRVLGSMKLQLAFQRTTAYDYFYYRLNINLINIKYLNSIEVNQTYLTASSCQSTVLRYFLFVAGRVVMLTS